jgi:Zn-dependent protease
MLSCPGCGALTRAEELKQLAAEAEGAGPAEALGRWRQAMALLPANSAQAKVIAGKIDTLSRLTEAHAPAEPERRKWKGLAASGGFVLAFLAKFKTAIFLLLGQGKLLLLGLTNAGTFVSMFASFGLYWSMYGWSLAGGLIASIYLHEMGHVFVLRRMGVPVTAPMFIPGFGAMVRTQGQYLTPREMARVGLAGPMWGLGAAAAAALPGLAWSLPAFLLIAKLGAWLNLFNLTPVWALDGARGFLALRRRERIIAAAAFAIAWLPSNPGAAVLAVGAGCYGVTRPNEPESTDGQSFWKYLALCTALASFGWLPVAWPPANNP